MQSVPIAAPMRSDEKPILKAIAHKGEFSRRRDGNFFVSALI